MCVAMPRNDSAMGHYEKELRQELAQKDPSLSSAQSARLEKEIQKAVMKHHKILQQNAAARASSPYPAAAKTRSDTGTRDGQRPDPLEVFPREVQTFDLMLRKIIS